MAALIAAIVVVAVLLILLVRTVRIVPQARAGVVERLGRYVRTQGPGVADPVAVRRPHAPADRPTRASRELPTAAGDHLATT